MCRRRRPRRRNCRSGVQSPPAAFASSLRSSVMPRNRPDPRGCSPQLLAPPEHIDAARQDVQDGEQHVHPETEDRIEEGDQDGTTGQARPQEHPAPSHSDQCVVQIRVHQVVVDRRVPVAPVEGELDREEIEAVCRDRQLLDFVVAEEGRRQREEADEEEEKVVQPDQSPIRTPDVVERDMVADPEHGNRDEAECVDEDAHEDGIAVRERLNRLTRDVRNGEAQPKDRHDRSEDAVRERFDPRLPQSRGWFLVAVLAIVLAAVVMSAVLLWLWHQTTLQPRVTLTAANYVSEACVPMGNGYFANRFRWTFTLVNTGTADGDASIGFLLDGNSLGYSH